MKISASIQESVLNATSKALATNGQEGLNVVPVSVVHVTDNSIWLFDFFMDKTVKNISNHPQVALTCWGGLSGVQIKATASYITDGDDFVSAKNYILQEFPERVLKGLLILKPESYYDISVATPKNI